jgi:8-oxo-dGTP diphosphatase
MVKVIFYDSIEDKKLDFAVIVARYKNQWVYCKHKDRDTYEVPGGHREIGETIFETAKRELYEETGVTKYELKPICVYSVKSEEVNQMNQKESFGALFFAEIKEFGKIPDFEMEKVELFDDLPEKLTYPEIQPKLIEKVISLTR